MSHSCAALRDAVKTRATQSSREKAQFKALVSSSLFRRLEEDYCRQTGYYLHAIGVDGEVLRSVHRLKSVSSKAVRAQAISEALRWGEPSVCLGDDDLLMWAVPIMVNQTLLGGLLVAGVPLVLPGEAGSLDSQVKHGCDSLLELAVANNLTNASLLDERRRDARRESERALAVQELKAQLYDDIRLVYLREEPALLAAIRRGDRGEARLIINRVLTAIYMLGRSRLDLLKSLCLELVVIMTRTAVQAGGAPARILGINYQSLSTLATLSDQESLSRWLCDMLELLVDEIQGNTRLPNSVQLGRAVEIMESRLGEALSRDEVAKASGLSPSHFSRLMRKKTGLSFTQLLSKLRIERACERLGRGEEIATVALECGFGDQSYFTHVFKRAIRKTPGEYRKEFAARSAPEARNHQR